MKMEIKKYNKKYSFFFFFFSKCYKIKMKLNLNLFKYKGILSYKIYEKIKERNKINK